MDYLFYTSTIATIFCTYPHLICLLCVYFVRFKRYYVEFAITIQGTNISAYFKIARCRDACNLYLNEMCSKLAIMSF